MPHLRPVTRARRKAEPFKIPFALLSRTKSSRTAREDEVMAFTDQEGLLDTRKLDQELNFKPTVSVSNDKPRLQADPGSRLRRAGLTAFGDFLSTANNEQILAIKLYASLPHGLHLQSRDPRP
jgi:hypothetical protein